MRVLLVYPGLHFEIAYPLGLAYIAAALREVGHEVRGYDVGLDGWAGLTAALETHSPDVVGLAVWSPNREQARRVAECVRAKSGARLVVGGPHVTVAAEDAMALTGADAAVIGEGERTVQELLAAWEEGRSLAEVTGCVWRTDSGTLMKTGLREVEADLGRLPSADREVFDPARYPHTWSRNAPPAAAVVTSRGCPMSCAHCPAPAMHRGRWRARSAESVVEELRELRGRGFGHVLIEDEHPTVDRRRWLALCRAIEQAELDLTWSCPNGLRPESLDPEVLSAMAQAGCTRIALGVEAAEAEQLRTLGRHPSPERVRQVALQANNEGIEVTAYFMLGLPDAGLREAWGLLRASRQLQVSGAHFSLFEPIPGSAMAAAPPAPGWCRWARVALYVGFYGHPRRMRQAFAAADARVSDVPAALQRLGGWLRYGKRHAGLGS